jgi:hypothetical protein
MEVMHNSVLWPCAAAMGGKPLEHSSGVNTC